MLPTPSTSHVSFDRIYEPAEDSFLLLDTLSSQSEISFLTDRFRASCPLILEVGTGSGVVLAFITAQAKFLFGRTDVLTLGTDINRFACQATRETVITASDERNTSSRNVKGQTTNASFLGPLLADLASPLRASTVDVLIFNPPYVPTEHVPEPPGLRNWTETTQDGRRPEEDSHLLSLSYAGGTEGMEVTLRLLEQIPDVLSWPRGVAYVVLCAQNRPERVKERIRTWPGKWSADTVGYTGHKGGWEKLQVIRIGRDMESSTAQTTMEQEQAVS
ncbi:MAG: S-adenosylmethionine-dependent methyltransferase [Peltula sp. TS41687]|nr:MAG: S-adenosylmethionine-dependent methyltransferase [Peltula sp. TS41687]